ncbi:unnamed protein product [Rhizophagus irregularis]|nr:unnamed protein product [Rhizophagus irregularis]
MKKIPKKLQKAFDEILDNELGQSFRKIHYNLVGISTSYKQTQGEFTEVPCHYTICSPERYFAPWENVKLGSSIEIIESQGTAGTLSAVVSDKHLEWIDLDDLKQSFGRIASEDEAYREISEKMCHVIDGHRQNSALARYERGMRSNFYSKAHQKNFGIDATFCIFANKRFPPIVTMLVKEYSKTLLIQEMNEMHQQCYPTVWFDLQFVFAFEYGGFEPGDSGANLLWLKKEKLLVSFMRHG